MLPSLNLKSFLAVLIILIVPAALLFAYFRNYSAEGGGHDHGVATNLGEGGNMIAMKPSDNDHDANGHNNIPIPRGVETQSDKEAEASKPPGARPQEAGGHAGMGSGKMVPSAVEQVPPSSREMPEPSRAVSTSEPLDMARSSSLPGVPGVSRLYHIGATDFFLNHPKHMTLKIEQQAELNRMKQKALLSKATIQRKIEETEQELWALTGADQPDVPKIQATVQAIEKLRSVQRMGFIQLVGEAAEVLTDEQRQMLLGTTEPESRANAHEGR